MIRLAREAWRNLDVAGKGDVGTRGWTSMAGGVADGVQREMKQHCRLMLSVLYRRSVRCDRHRVWCGRYDCLAAVPHEALLRRMPTGFPFFRCSRREIERILHSKRLRTLERVVPAPRGPLAGASQRRAENSMASSSFTTKQVLPRSDRLHIHRRVW
nr:hypothetical protein CFP56_30046 [Quercus suber]